MAEHAVGVVGLGGLGSAAAYWLARRGVDVVGFEQFELGHVRGASHDHSRIIRRSYHTPHYVRLAGAAYDAWRPVEQESGTEIVTVTGGIDLFPPGAAIDPTSYTGSLAAEGVPFEVLGGAEVARRWPAFGAGSLLTAEVGAIHSAETGIVPAGRATATMQSLAMAHGATLRERTAVREVRPVGGEVDVVTDNDVVRCGTVIIAADAWTERLLAPLDVSLPLVVQREQVTYFDPPDLAAFAPGRFPVWIWMDDPSFYGFPVYGDPTAVKASEDCGGREVDPDTRTFEPDDAAEQRLARFMVELFGAAIGRPRRSVTCLYTLDADRDFVLDRVPGAPQVLVALGAAHGFKFASWFGRTLADLVVDGSTDQEVAPFALDRPALRAPLERAAWMV
jgi:sarcosine oxidase